MREHSTCGNNQAGFEFVSKARSSSYIGFGAVVTADIGVLLTEAFVEIQLAKVGEQLDSSALHHVLAEVHHTVEVVVMSCLCVSVTFSVHCGEK